MKTCNFEKLDTGNVLVTCNEVIDHPDHMGALQELCEGIKGGVVGLESAEMLNDGELEFKILIAIPKVVKKRDKAATLPAAVPEEEEEPARRSHHKGK